MRKKTFTRFEPSERVSEADPRIDLGTGSESYED